MSGASPAAMTVPGAILLGTKDSKKWFLIIWQYYLCKLTILSGIAILTNYGSMIFANSKKLLRRQYCKSAKVWIKVIHQLEIIFFGEVDALYETCGQVMSRSLKFTQIHVIGDTIRACSWDLSKLS